MEMAAPTYAVFPPWFAHEPVTILCST